MTSSCKFLVLFFLLLATVNAQSRPPRPSRGGGIRNIINRASGGRGGNRGGNRERGGDDNLRTQLQDLMRGNKNETFVQNVTCPAVLDEPLCAVGRPVGGNITEGTWMCRTLYDPVSGDETRFNACVRDTTKSLAKDTCGCCDGNCPEICPCPCDLPSRDGSGAWMLGGRNDDREICVPTERAIVQVARISGGPACLEVCPVVNTTTP